MREIIIKQQPAVKAKFETYPEAVLPKLAYLRSLIIETAKDLGTIQEIEESLKWGEPSYKVKKGSPIRIDWKAKAPDQYAMYFICSTSLVDTFKMEYGDLFEYEKNRAIVFRLADQIPIQELKSCISMALQYHAANKLPGH